jgi:hypothetical protein
MAGSSPPVLLTSNLVHMYPSVDVTDQISVQSDSWLDHHWHQVAKAENIKTAIIPGFWFDLLFKVPDRGQKFKTALGVGKFFYYLT